MTLHFNKEAMRQSAVTIDDGDVLTMGPEDSLSVGAAWNASERDQGGAMGKVSKRIGADLDAGATLIQGGQLVEKEVNGKTVLRFEGGEPVLMAWMNNLDPVEDRSIIHTGDNTTGAGSGDDETVEIPRLGSISTEFDSLVFFIANFKKPKLAERIVTGGQGDIGFSGAEGVKMTLYTASGGDHQAFTVRPSLLSDDNVCLLARADRISKGDANSQWAIRKISKMTSVPRGDRRALLRAAMAAQ